MDWAQPQLTLGGEKARINFITHDWVNYALLEEGSTFLSYDLVQTTFAAGP